MNTSTLTNYQLYELIQNTNLDKALWKAANNEFDRRQVGLDEVNEIIARHDKAFVPPTDKGLSIFVKIMLIICPFFIELGGLFAGWQLAKGRKRKWKDYWMYVCIGFLLWTFAVILFAKYYLFKQK